MSMEYGIRIHARRSGKTDEKAVDGPDNSFLPGQHAPLLAFELPEREASERDGQRPAARAGRLSHHHGQERRHRHDL